MLEQKNDNLHEAEGLEGMATENMPTETENTVTSLEDSIAIDSEEEASKDEILPLQDYTNWSMEQLVDELEKIATLSDVTTAKEPIEEVKRNFLTKFNELLDEKKAAFYAENVDENATFSYDFPLKNRFDAAMNGIRNKRNEVLKNQQNKLKQNLADRETIIEELRHIFDSDIRILDMLKKVNELRERWKTIGPIPRDKYNHVWNNYHFHIERFYDYLHLDKEARDQDFKNNLEQKQRIIERVEVLVDEADVPKAFKELQRLHRVWKEDIGPVSKEHREDIWNRFSELTKQIHDKREQLFEKFREKETENLVKKKEIIQNLSTVVAEPIENHNQWQGQIKKVEELRAEFLKAGKVPLENVDEVWNEFKKVLRDFNASKNNFYKNLKNEQNDNLTKKLALIEQANQLKDTEDFANATAVFQKIQEDWKAIGHVPRKFSDELWKNFKDACNHYFDRYHAYKKEANKVVDEVYEQKKAYLEGLKSFELTGDHKTDLDGIKKHIESWKTLGKVSEQKRHIDRKFNKILDVLFEKLSMSKKDSEMMRFSNHLENLKGSDDKRKLENEHIFINRKIDEIQNDLFQLENNIQFISSSKANNPLIKEVEKSIEKLREDLKIWKDKQKQIRILKDA